MNASSTFLSFQSFSATFSSTEFGWFREQSPLSSAVHYAREGKPEAIFELFTQHAEHLEHHWLPLLMQFPETLHPDVYSKVSTFGYDNYYINVTFC